MNLVNSRKEAIVLLKQLQEKGYIYVARDKDMPYLICFSLKPKKHLDTASWGYVNPDAQEVMGAYPIKNIDISEINWTNRSASLISDFLM